MWGLIKAIVQTVIAPAAILYLRQKVIKTEEDQNRYDLIAAIAKEAAEEAVLRLPDTEVDDLVLSVVNDIHGSVPTGNREVIYRAAAAAVRRAVREYREEPPA